jgi:hypothetical protein
MVLLDKVCMGLFLSCFSLVVCYPFDNQQRLNAIHINEIGKYAGIIQGCTPFK